MADTTSFGQVIGPKVTVHDAKPPTTSPINGTHVVLEHLDISRHGADLWESIGQNEAGWTYIPNYGPYTTKASFDSDLEKIGNWPGCIFYTVILRSTSRAVGILALINKKPSDRAIEIGFVVFSPILQRTVAATETFYLLARHVFDDCGYRRYVWKCDSLNAPSRAAAARLGFVHEGIHRHDIIVKGRNRDTAWFSITEEEWPVRKRAFERWLAADNFDEEGRQLKGLVELREEEEVREKAGS